MVLFSNRVSGLSLIGMVVLSTTALGRELLCSGNQKFNVGSMPSATSYQAQVTKDSFYIWADKRWGSPTGCSMDKRAQGFEDLMEIEYRFPGDNRFETRQVRSAAAGEITFSQPIAEAPDLLELLKAKMGEQKDCQVNWNSPTVTKVEASQLTYRRYACPDGVRHVFLALDSSGQAKQLGYDFLCKKKKK